MAVVCGQPQGEVTMVLLGGFAAKTGNPYEGGVEMPKLWRERLVH
jgi:hypothetical protein